MSLLVSDFFLPLLLKGLGWMALCGLIALALPRSGKIWRTGLVSLTLLSGLCALPAVWTWYLPERQPAAPEAEAAPAGPSEIRITVEDEPVRFERTPAPIKVEKTPPVLTAWQCGRLLLLLWAGGTGGLAVWRSGWREDSSPPGAGCGKACPSRIRAGGNRWRRNAGAWASAVFPACCGARCRGRA
ncbi:MAG: hypothetical protein V4726_04085 [Verrucomicrobiota bacterium]